MAKFKGWIFWYSKQTPPMYAATPSGFLWHSCDGAYIYTVDEAKAEFKQRGSTWQSKSKGKWIAVWENDNG